MKFRYPDFGAIRNTVVVFIIIYLGSIIIFKQQALGFEFFKIISIVCSVLCVLEFIVLNIYWKSMVFDKVNNKLIVKKHIFFFVINTSEFPLQSLSVYLNKRLMLGAVGAGPGWVWWLYLDDNRNNKFYLANSPFKSFLAKKQQKIIDFIKQ